MRRWCEGFLAAEHSDSVPARVPAAARLSAVFRLCWAMQLLPRGAESTVLLLYAQSDGEDGEKSPADGEVRTPFGTFC